MYVSIELLSSLEFLEHLEIGNGVITGASFTQFFS